MLAELLTKSMTSDKLTEALRTNKWDLAQPIESLRNNRIKQPQRAAAKKNKKIGAAVPEADDMAINPISGDHDYEPVTLFHCAYACVYVGHAPWQCME